MTQAVLVGRISPPYRSALVYELASLDISRALHAGSTAALAMGAHLIALDRSEQCHE